MATNDLHRSNWTVQVLTLQEAVDLMRRHHYSRSAANTATYRHGLFRRDEWPLGYPYGATLWIPPTRSAAEAISNNWGGVLALSRLVCTPSAPRNSASFLLAASMRMIDRSRWPTLVTYADTRFGHTGAIYKATGWHCDGPVPAGDVWVNEAGEQRGRKRGPATLSSAQMRELGFTRAPAAPKIRYTHTIPQ